MTTPDDMLPAILAEARALAALHNQTVATAAAALRDRAVDARNAYAVTIPRRNGKWQSPEGERVAAMKARLDTMDDLIRRLDDLATPSESLGWTCDRLEKDGER